MSISFECQSCGKKLKAPDSAVGKSSKCPQCGAKVTCPEPIYDAEVADDAEGLGGVAFSGSNALADLDDGSPYALKDPDPYAPPAGDAAEGPRRPCPMCGEMILTSAAKCRFCGEVFDPKLKKKSKKKYGADSADMSAGDWVVALLCPGIGCIAGIVWMIQGKPKGTKMFGISFAVNAFWTVVQILLRSQMNPQGGP
ncbi:hypothetical protein OJF2_27290 [Aquisphaera giovannonii]|uniref:Double zinc ribbon n=1 Tax=Aquisphaera giovannonii TaxID=406548 RepID=A0A5B9W1T5_9BACT|nr:hypothetical protein [Aquisphaera giovannonii]QEH34194.1 hypothetical protein OJF2_27290 [Aquisphaera giovannonii]